MKQPPHNPETGPELRGSEYFVYIGTYTGGASRGIYACRFSAQGPVLGAPSLAAEAVNPSFLCVHSNGRFLYAVGEISHYNGQPTGLVMAYAIDRNTGSLRFLNQVPSCGPGPCHISTDKTGRTILVANYVGGSIAAISVLDDGSLSNVTSFQQHSASGGCDRHSLRPRAHGAFVSIDNRFVVVPDLGLNRLLVYRFVVESGTLECAEELHAKLPPGAGPRHFAFHPSGRYGYVICETDCKIRSFRFDSARGHLCQLDEVSTLPSAYHEANIAAGIQIDREGRFLYASNRGADCIAVIAVHDGGRLKPVKHVASGGRTPRHISIDPTGSYLLVANQEAGGIVLFQRDQVTGHLSPQEQRYEVDAPACIAFAPASPP